MRAIVCGGRNYADRKRVHEVLDGLVRERGLSCVIEGGAPGADRLAREWAKERGIEVVTFPANWALFGKRAGPIRNSIMLRDGKPDLVVAFTGNKGTDDMIRQATIERVEVMKADQ